MSSKPVLRIDWATHEAAAYACKNWHYSRSLPVGKLIKVGVWEDESFIGCILFSRGASPKLGHAYTLSQTELCELTRIALTRHTVPVSRIAAIAIKFCKKQSPGLRLVVSFADPEQGHHGGIYQAGGWLYSGRSAVKADYIGPDGKRYLSRQVAESGGVKQFGKTTAVYKRSECVAVNVQGKHRYLMPLDDDMRAKIAPLSKPYPKRTKEQDTGHPPVLGGASPTRALHLEEDHAGANP